MIVVKIQLGWRQEEVLVVVVEEGILVQCTTVYMTHERYIHLYRMIQKGEHEIDCKKKSAHLMISLQKIVISTSYIISTHTRYKLTGVLAKQVSPPPQSLGAPLGQGR